MNLELFTALAQNPVRLLVNAADILIVSYVIYRLLLIVRGTRAEQLLRGLFFFLLFSVFARWADLKAVNWLLEKSWTGIFIAIPVVFQPELRKALEQLGRGGFFPGYNDKNRADEAVINDVVRAVADLSVSKTGALIVWERETGLKDFQEIGVPLDAVVTQDLLLNIFTPKSPLHDGAVIIKQGRIEKAGVCLPLSDSLNLGKHLGTRHRAAAGITEVSDALAVVVSEETGSISIARNGRLIRNLSEYHLKSLLLEEMAPKISRKPKGKRGENDAGQ
ncbi:MAG: diadenylate cyclase CdaA [Solirubrobacterales bacterium]